MQTIRKKYSKFLALGLILLLAFSLRVVKLNQTPSGFHADEASFYINALSLAKTGMDEDGNKLPLSLSSLIDPKPALFSYLQIPFLGLFNDPIFAARIISVLLATVSLFLVYLFTKEVVSRRLALIITLVLTVSPWHIVVSRGTQEVIASFVFLLLSLYLSVLIIKKAQVKNYLLLSSFFISSFLSMYFYHSAKVVLPLLLVSLLFFLRRKTKNYLKLVIVTISLVFLAGLLSIKVVESNSRFKAVSIFSDQGPNQQLLAEIYSSRNTVPAKILRVYYNKAKAYSFALSKEYLSYFSPEFLVLSGEKPTRYIVPDHGLIYLIEVPLLLLGLYLAISKKRKELPIFLAILFISPVPAALTTQETPSLLRSFPMVIALSYFIAISLNHFLLIKNKVFRYALLILVIAGYSWSLGYFALQYHVQAKYDKPWFRNSPYSKIAKEVAKIESEYQTIEITNDLRPLYAYFVIEKLIPIKELQDHPYARNQANYRLGKFIFNKDVCQFKEIKANTLYIAEVGCREKNQKLKNLELVKTISYDDGLKVYELLQVAN